MYKIYLEGKRLKRNQITGMHLMVGFLLIGIGMVTWLVPDSVKQTELHFLNYFGLIYTMLGFLIVLICIFFNKKVIQTKANLIIRIIEIIALFLMLVFSVYKKWYLPLGYSSAALIGIITTYFLEKNNKKDKTVIFHDTGIKISGLARHSNAKWDEIKNIILKNNILTIDFRNNKLYQANLSNNNADLNQIDFLKFTQIKIAENKEKYKEDW